MEVIFRALHPWAILPKKRSIDRKPVEEEARLLEDHFVWARASRAPEFCWPWRMGQEIGWVIESPVTVTMDALHDVEAISPPDAESIRHLSQLAGASENWAFRDSNGKVERMHFTRRGGWTALYDFRVADGSVERMFWLNGHGTLEWVMGWEAVLPPGFSLLLMPFENITNLEVLIGVLPASSLAKRAGRTNGFSIGIRPRGPVTIRRGQPLARIILLHADSLRVRANVDTEATDTSSEGHASVP